MPLSRSDSLRPPSTGWLPGKGNQPVDGGLCILDSGAYGLSQRGAVMDAQDGMRRNARLEEDEMSEKTVRFLLALSPDLLSKVDIAAASVGLTRTGYLRKLIERGMDYYDPFFMLGYWQVVGGKINPDDECCACGTRIGSQPWLGIDAGYRIRGPLCARCAGSD